MKDLLSAIFNIFKFVGKIFTFIRNSIFNLILLALVFILVLMFIPSSEVSIPDNSTLKLKISGNIVEQKRIVSSLEKYFEDSFDLNGREAETALQDVLDTIHRSGDDKRISAILLDMKNMKGASLSQLMTIGDALLEFRSKNKLVIASEDQYSQHQYFLASYADKVILNPMGLVDIHGYGVYRLYFKEAMNRLKINYNIFKVGTYKSALEPFTRDSMSDEDREQNQLWLSQIWQLYVDQVAARRSIDRRAIDNYTSNIAKALETTQGDAAKLALESGLVDEVWTREQVSQYLVSLHRDAPEKPRFVSSATYGDSYTSSYSGNTNAKPSVGLILAEGAILPGKQPSGFIGGETLGNLIKNARKDDNVKALVLRINTGGGSAFASEIIRQEILALKRAGKPVIVSMGSVAASGGYWIAADADQIWASQATITGSIGIFGAIPTFENSLAELGISSDGTGTTPLASGLNLAQPLPEQLKKAIQQSVNHSYDRFIRLVAKGRKMDGRQVEKLAQGRVYDGRSAQKLGLVDELGSLDDALKAAAQLAGLTDYSTRYIKPSSSVKTKLLSFFTKTSGRFIKNELPHSSPVTQIQDLLKTEMQDLEILQDPRGIYAICPVRPQQL